MLFRLKSRLRLVYHQARWISYRSLLGGPIAVWDYLNNWWYHWISYKIRIHSILEVPKYIGLHIKLAAACFVWAWLDVVDDHKNWIAHLNTEAEDRLESDWKSDRKLRWYFVSLLWTKEHEYLSRVNNLEVVARSISHKVVLTGV